MAVVETMAGMRNVLDSVCDEAPMEMQEEENGKPTLVVTATSGRGLPGLQNSTVISGNLATCSRAALCDVIIPFGGPLFHGSGRFAGPRSGQGRRRTVELQDSR